MFEKFTDRARRVVVLSSEESKLHKHNHIGSEHLLLGLIHEGEGIPARVLTEHGITLESVRSEVVKHLGIGTATSPKNIPFTPRAKKVLKNSDIQSIEMGYNYIGTEHIFLGLLEERDSTAVKILLELGLNPKKLHEATIAMLDEITKDPKSANVPSTFENQDELYVELDELGTDLAEALSGIYEAESPEAVTRILDRAIGKIESRRDQLLRSHASWQATEG